MQIFKRSKVGLSVMSLTKWNCGERQSLWKRILFWLENSTMNRMLADKRQHLQWKIEIIVPIFYATILEKNAFIQSDNERL